jgi:protoheme IX farnesyltransferase
MLREFFKPKKLEKVIPSLVFSKVSAFTEVKKPSNLQVISSLTKSRLSTLVVLTSMSGYAMAPTTCSSSPALLLTMTVGTALCVASANSLNQWLEVPYDSQMSRTRNRTLVKKQVDPLYAVSFSSFSGLSGCLLLHSINPVASLLGGLNILLYSGIYTPMKRFSYYNTWIGSVVGAIPPLIGWTAVGGSLGDPSAWLLGYILFAWQFPHFNSLSFNIRDDYAKAGYRMMAVDNPLLNASVSLRYSLSLFPACFLLSYFGTVDNFFILTSSIPNAFMSWKAYKFYRCYENKEDANSLFFSSLYYLPTIIILMLIHKREWSSGKNRKKEE